MAQSFLKRWWTCSWSWLALVPQLYKHKQCDLRSGFLCGWSSSHLFSEDPVQANVANSFVSWFVSLKCKLVQSFSKAPPVRGDPRSYVLSNSSTSRLDARVVFYILQDAHQTQSVFSCFSCFCMFSKVFQSFSDPLTDFAFQNPIGKGTWGHTSKESLAPRERTPLARCFLAHAPERSKNIFFGLWLRALVVQLSDLAKVTVRSAICHSCSKKDKTLQT